MLIPETWQHATPTALLHRPQAERRRAPQVSVVGRAPGARGARALRQAARALRQGCAARSARRCARRAPALRQAHVAHGRSAPSRKRARRVRALSCRVDHGRMSDPLAELSPYEQERQRNIERNRAELERLGVEDRSAAKKLPPAKKRHRQEAGASDASQPSSKRSSARLSELAPAAYVEPRDGGPL